MTDAELLDALSGALDRGLITSLTVVRHSHGVTIGVGPVSVDGFDFRAAASTLVDWLALVPAGQPERRR